LHAQARDIEPMVVQRHDGWLVGSSVGAVFIRQKRWPGT
jgi:hypothetical protein